MEVEDIAVGRALLNRQSYSLCSGRLTSANFPGLRGEGGVSLLVYKLQISFWLCMMSEMATTDFICLPALKALTFQNLLC